VVARVFGMVARHSGWLLVIAMQLLRYLGWLLWCRYVVAMVFLVLSRALLGDDYGIIGGC